jgi:two-component system, NtrC family, sensor kinase
MDDGPGIPPEHPTRIFEPFFTTKPESQGTGLGLSICQRIVTDLKGTLTGESQPGEGATFMIRLPVIAVVRPA